MPIITLKGHPAQVDFPAGIERSVKGALHLLPNVSREITPDELSHIQKAHPALFVRLYIQPDPKPAPALKAQESAPEPKRESKKARSRE